MNAGIRMEVNLGQNRVPRLCASCGKAVEAGLCGTAKQYPLVCSNFGLPVSIDKQKGLLHLYRPIVCI
jgi:hypothetical protein